MKRGFTLLELLVAGVLFGMVVTVMTMLMNQSSVSWRLGTAVVENLDEVRNELARLRDEADAAFVWNEQVYRSVSPWNHEGALRRRACDADGERAVRILRDKGLPGATGPWTACNEITDVGSFDKGGAFRNYMVNVMSGGPQNDINDWQAIWSFPDDFE